jgi:hypothetical protein
MEMKKSYMKIGTSIAVASVLMLAGCGGGGGNDLPYIPPPEAPPEAAVAYNGKFVDGAVAGVSFVCGTVSGITDINGIFGTCPAESTVTFSIGDLILGSSSATGDGIFFVTDIVGVSRDAIDNEDVLKIAVLLQSLDTDGDPSNGIDVPAEAAALLPAGDITERSIEEVEDGTAAVVAELKVIYPEMVVVTVEEAEANLAESEAEIDAGIIAPPPAPTGSEGA